jgi:hypothetical protein
VWLVGSPPPTATFARNAAAVPVIIDR